MLLQEVGEERGHLQLPAQLGLVGGEGFPDGHVCGRPHLPPPLQLEQSHLVSSRNGRPEWVLLGDSSGCGGGWVWCVGDST